MEIQRKSDFFQKYCKKIRENLSENQLNEFSELKDNESRFKYVNGFKDIVQELKLAREFKGKNLEKALECKNTGNKAFQKSHWSMSLMCYNSSVLYCPNENVAEKAIILANRSAALYHLEKYDAALKDIDRAYLNYPKEMMYKLMERKARCLLANKEHSKSLEAFRETITALDNSKLPLEKRQKLEKDALIMTKVLPRTIEQENKIKAKKTEKQKKPLEHFLLKSLYFDKNEAEGRFTMTSEDIKVNEIILFEKPHVSCLLEEYSWSHCHHCFKRALVFVSCPKCIDIIFCSDECEKAANSSYHKIECGFLQTLWRAGISITCHMALRMISQKTDDYFLNIKDQLEALKSEDTDKLTNDDYRKVYKLVTHEATRTSEDLLERTMMASFLHSCLNLGEFYQNKEAENFIGGLILHNIQFLQFNAHEISELQKENKTDVGKSTFIGGGLYPTLALFNHSCDPGVTRYYKGNAVCVRTVKNIKSGCLVAENYGQLFTQNPRHERQLVLKEQYKFDCNCQPCQENWPLFKEMENDYMRYKCENGNCKNVLKVPFEVNDFMIKCTECGEFTNIMKGLKMMQDTETLFRFATRSHENGETEDALSKYVEMINLFDQFLCPPFRDFHVCQQGVRSCLLEFGNHFTKNPY